MAKKTYTQSQLSLVASQVKRQILNKVKKDNSIKFTKTEAFDMISKKLRLSSSRTLWIGDTSIYLNEWYIKLSTEISLIMENNQTHTKNIDSEHPSKNAEQDLMEIDNVNALKELLKNYEEIIKVLREENEMLRVLAIEKHGKIDLF
jgi:FMN phosphatase YigB (HAD superfamily)